jgi:hypothetical protein
MFFGQLRMGKDDRDHHLLPQANPFKDKNGNGIRGENLKAWVYI